MQISQERHALVEINDVRRVAFGAFLEYQRRSKCDAFVCVRYKSLERRFSLVSLDQPSLPQFLHLQGSAELFFGVGKLFEFPYADVQPMHASTIVAQEQIPKSISSDQAHFLRAKPAPVGEKTVDVEMAHGEIALNLFQPILADENIHGYE